MKLVANCISQPSAVRANSGLAMIPALFTRMCSGPVRRSTNRVTDRWSDNSSGCTKIASLPVLRTSSAATWSPAAVRRTARVTSVVMGVMSFPVSPGGGGPVAQLRPNRGEDLLELGLAVTRGDVLRAVPVEGDDGHDDDLLDDRPVPRHRQLGDDVGSVACVESAGAAEDLQPQPVRVVHEEQRHPFVAGDVPGADVLAVPPESGPRDRVLVRAVDEAGRSAPELDVRPSAAGHAGEVE